MYAFRQRAHLLILVSDLYFHSSLTGENFSLHSVLKLAKYTPVQGPRHTAELCSAPQSTQRCWAQETERCFTQPRKVHTGAGPKAHSGALLSPAKYAAVLGPAVLRIRDVYLGPVFYPSRIPDPKTAAIERGGKNLFS
jgi:hypothetical protein